MTDYKLPELPDTVKWVSVYTDTGPRLCEPAEDVFVTDQLHAYAIAAIQQRVGQGEAVARGEQWTIDKKVMRLTSSTADLYLSGNFSSLETLLAYAEALRDKLNAPQRVKVTREALEKASAAYCVAALSDDPSNLSSNAMLAALQSLGFGVEV